MGRTSKTAFMWFSILVIIFQENLEPPVDHLPRNSRKLALRQQNLTWSNRRNKDIRIGVDQTQWDTLCINDKLHIQIQPPPMSLNRHTNSLSSSSVPFPKYNLSELPSLSHLDKPSQPGPNWRRDYEADYSVCVKTGKMEGNEEASGCTGPTGNA